MSSRITLQGSVGEDAGVSSREPRHLSSTRQTNLAVWLNDDDSFDPIDIGSSESQQRRRRAIAGAIGSRITAGDTGGGGIIALRSDTYHSHGSRRLFEPHSHNYLLQGAGSQFYPDLQMTKPEPQVPEERKAGTKDAKKSRDHDEIIFLHIRQALSTRPSVAEEIIQAVLGLSENHRQLLRLIAIWSTQDDHSSDADDDSSQYSDETGSDDDDDDNDVVPSGFAATSSPYSFGTGADNGSTTRPSGSSARSTGKASRSSTEKSTSRPTEYSGRNKKNKHRGSADDGEDEEDQNGGGRKRKKLRTDIDDSLKTWLCPYLLCGIEPLKSCRHCEGERARRNYSDLVNHLEKHRLSSQEDPVPEDRKDLFMTEEQWENVKNEPKQLRQKFTGDGNGNSNKNLRRFKRVCDEVVPKRFSKYADLLTSPYWEDVWPILEEALVNEMEKNQTSWQKLPEKERNREIIRMVMPFRYLYRDLRHTDNPPEPVSPAPAAEQSTSQQDETTTLGETSASSTQAALAAPVAAVALSQQRQTEEDVSAGFASHVESQTITEAQISHPRMGSLQNPTGLTKSTSYDVGNPLPQLDGNTLPQQDASLSSPQPHRASTGQRRISEGDIARKKQETLDLKRRLDQEQQKLWHLQLQEAEEENRNLQADIDLLQQQRLAIANSVSPTSQLAQLPTVEPLDPGFESSQGLALPQPGPFNGPASTSFPQLGADNASQSIHQPSLDAGTQNLGSLEQPGANISLDTNFADSLLDFPTEDGGFGQDQLGEGEFTSADLGLDEMDVDASAVFSQVLSRYR